MILTKQFLQERVQQYKQSLYESERFSTEKLYDVFISHSYLDKDLINELYTIFSECGYRVFIDWKESELQDRNAVSIETANKLKDYMNSSKGLLYVATENATNSKWCPWELGYVDGKKERVAILPILNEKQDEFKGQEYLGIYPYISFENSKNDFLVRDPSNFKKYNTLREWLQTGALIEH